MKTILSLAAIFLGTAAGIAAKAPMTVKFLVFLMTLDYLSGVSAAVVGRSRKNPSGKLSSKTGFVGLLKKAMILAIVLMAAVLDHILAAPATLGAVTLFYIVNESISILENAVLLGVPVPKKLRNVLDVARETEDTPPAD